MLLKYAHNQAQTDDICNLHSMYINDQSTAQVNIYIFKNSTRQI